MASSPPRGRRRDLDDDDLEEGEDVPGGYESPDTDGDARFVVQPRGQEGEGCSEDRGSAAWRASAARPSPTPSRESDGTLSDDDDPSSSSVIAPPVRVYACHVCAKEFGSPKAVDGHMRVHDPRGRHGQQQGKGKEERYVAVNGGWAATGKRGWTGGKDKAVSSSAQLNHPMDIVVAEPRPPLQPTPMAFAVTNLSSMSMASARNNLLNSGDRSSAQQIHNDPMATVVAGANHPTDAVVHHQPSAPPPAAEQAPVVQRPSQPPPPAQQAQVVHQLAVAPPAAQQAQVARQPTAPRREYTCKICGKSYPTNQGLGGHAAGHRNRQKEAEAATAPAGILLDGSVIPDACRRDAKQEMTTHPCKKCNKVFAKGVSLGGHMRRHYIGPPIVHGNKKRRLAPPPVVVVVPPPAQVPEDLANLTLALSIKAEEASPVPAMVGRVRLFGIDIGPQVQVPSEQQGSDTTEGSPSEQRQGSGTTEGSPSEQRQGSGTTEGSPSVQQQGSGTAVDSPSEQQGSGKTVGSSSAGGEQGQ